MTRLGTVRRAFADRLRLMFQRQASTPDLEEIEQRERRSAYLEECEQIRRTWDLFIASAGCILAGSTIDPVITQRGWVGHVQALISHSDILTGHRRELGRAIETAFELPAGAVLVDWGYRHIGDTACVWAYRRPGEVDYHKRLPHTVFGQEFADHEPPLAGLTSLERSELKSWARKHKDMLDAIERGNFPVDMEQVSRRYNRMRGAILDALTKVDPATVRELLVERGLDYFSVGEDIGALLGMPTGR